MAIITSSIGTTARDYSTMQAWEDAIPANVVASGNSYVGKCYNDSEFTDALAISGHTASKAFTITLTTGTGQSFRDHADVQTNPLKYDQSKGVGMQVTTNFVAILDISNTYTKVTNIQSKATADSANAISTASANEGRTIEHCIFEAAASQGNQIGYQTIGRNNIFIQRGNAVTDIITCGDGARLFNCTCVSQSSLGTAPTSAVQTFTNISFFEGCAFFGASTNVDFGGLGLFSNCYTNLATALPGLTQATYNNSLFVDTTDDWRIPSGSTLINAIAIDYDIAGTERPSDTSRDVGSWEYYVAAEDTNAVNYIGDTGSILLKIAD